METQPATPTLIERFNAWLQESIMIKLLSIGFLLIILLIPSAWIQQLINERQYRAIDARNEVAQKWSNSQTLSGPVLVIPFKRQEVIDRGKDGIEIREHIERAYFLPQELAVNGNVKPTILRRGIFDEVVYSADLDIQASFLPPDFTALNIDEKFVQWQNVQLIFGITDLRGIRDTPGISVGGSKFTADPSSNLGFSSAKSADNADYTTTTASTYSNFSTSGIATKLNWTTAADFKGNIDLQLALKGSRRLDFVPAGKTTNVKLTGSWKDPSFDGEFLPDTRTLSDSGFAATWKVLHFNRPLAQQWIGNDQQLAGSVFGVNLLIPVDQYQMSTRTAKYGELIILLTFISLFLIEIIQKIRIHPFQYILIGAALTIYYTLLLSFSEHFGYNLSYAIASIATITLISLYATTFLRSAKLVMAFTSVLMLFYVFIFVIIQEQDYSLMLGSIGLFIIIGVLMYFSRKINWYKDAAVVKS